MVRSQKKDGPGKLKRALVLTSGLVFLGAVADKATHTFRNRCLFSRQPAAEGPATTVPSIPTIAKRTDPEKSDIAVPEPAPKPVVATTAPVAPATPATKPTKAAPKPPETKTKTRKPKTPRISKKQKAERAIRLAAGAVRTAESAGKDASGAQEKLQEARDALLDDEYDIAKGLATKAATLARNAPKKSATTQLPCNRYKGKVAAQARKVAKARGLSGYLLVEISVDTAGRATVDSLLYSDPKKEAQHMVTSFNPAPFNAALRKKLAPDKLGFVPDAQCNGLLNVNL